MKFEKHIYTLPSYWASAIINGDMSGLENEEEKQLNEFLQSVEEKGHWDIPGQNTINSLEETGEVPLPDYNESLDTFEMKEEDSQEPSFYKYHDAQPFGVLAADCIKFVYNVQVPELEKKEICVWADYEWCYKEEIEEYLNAPMAKSDDYIIVELAFEEEPTLEQLKECIDGNNYNINYDNVVRNVVENVDTIQFNNKLNNSDIKI